MTSIEYILNWMTKNKYYIGNDLLTAFEEAEKMHKQEIIDAYYNGADIESDSHGTMNTDIKDAEQYYNETFKKD